MRQARLAAEADGDTSRAKELRLEVDGALATLGSVKARDASPWSPQRAVEVQPGVYLQDGRP